jgi:hypothetical protein
VKGSSSKFERLLGVRIELYRHREHIIYSSSPPLLPYRFASLVSGIFGLDNATTVKPFHQVAPYVAGKPPFTPQQIRSAYGVTPLLNRGIDGSGQNITVVVAYGSPTISTDLDVFSSQYSIARPHGSIYYPLGQPTVKDPGWARETMLDVVWSSVMAPGATINVVVSPNPSTVNLFYAVNFAVSRNLGKIISLSWGGNENLFDVDYEPIFQQAVAQGISIFVASGDCGAFGIGSSGCTQSLAVSYPASSAYVTAVGGTSLFLDSQDRYAREVGWSKSGGGVSTIFTKPSWQSGSGVPAGSYRSIPDISLVGDPATGVPIYVNGTWVNSIGGTSLSAPLMAGVHAVANHMRGSNLGFASPLIYPKARSATYGSVIRDVSAGSNGYYQSGQNYDLVTGWGSPDAELLAASFSGQLRKIDMTSSISGSNVINIDGGWYIIPRAHWFASGTTHTFVANTTVSGPPSVRYVFTGWSGLSSGPEPTKSIQIVQNGSLTLSYKTQYLVSVSGGSQPFSNWFDEGSTPTITSQRIWNEITNRSRLNLIGYRIGSGNMISIPRSNSGIFTAQVTPLNSPFTLNFIAVNQYYLTIRGSLKVAATPASFTGDNWFDEGQSVVVTGSGILNEEGGIRSRITGWSIDGGSVIPVSTFGNIITPPITMSAPRTVAFISVTQYRIGSKFIQGSFVRITPSPNNDGWFDSGSKITLSLNNVWNITSKSRNNLVSLFNGTKWINITRTGQGESLFEIAVLAPLTIENAGSVQYYLAINGGQDAKLEGSPTADNWFDLGSTANVTLPYVWNLTQGKSRDNLASVLLDNDPVTYQRKGEGRYSILVRMQTTHSVTFRSTSQYFLTLKGGYEAKALQSQTNDSWYDTGSRARVKVRHMLSGNIVGTRINLVSWQLDFSPPQLVARRGSGNFSTPEITVDAPHSIAFAYASQSLLTLQSGGQSISKPASATQDNWYDNSTTVIVETDFVWDTKPKSSRSLLIAWQLDSSQSLPITRSVNGRFETPPVSMAGPHTVAFQSITQFYVDVVTPFGNSGGDGWYDSGSEAALSIEPLIDQVNQTRRIFMSWKGDIQSINPIVRVLVDKPKAVQADWKTQYFVAVVSAYGKASGTGWFDKGSVSRISVEPQIDHGNRTRHLLTGWQGSEANTPAFDQIVMRPLSIEAKWKTQYLLMLVSLEASKAINGTGWYDHGILAQIMAEKFVYTNELTRFAFNRWEGNNIKDSSPLTKILISSPMDVKAVWQREHLLTLIFVDNIGRNVTPTEAILLIGDNQSISSEPYRIWVREGLSVRIDKVGYAHVDVAPVKPLQLIVDNPTEQKVVLRIYDAKIRVVDPFGVPISAAKVKVRLANNTLIDGSTDNEGSFRLNSIPLGTFSASITSFGLGVETKVDLPTPSVQVLFPLSNQVISVATSVGIGALVFVFRKRIMKIRFN